MDPKVHGIENWFPVSSNLPLLPRKRNLQELCFPTMFVFFLLRVLYMFNAFHLLLLQRSGGMLVFLAKLAPLWENPRAHLKQM